METVTISARISAKKKAEFFQTTESLKPLINKYCNDLKINVDSNDNLDIQIVFESKDQLENYFNRNEFDILKGSVMSLCNNINVKINNSVVN
jgi:uncharacterized protein YpiB (UPF0302 family)